MTVIVYNFFKQQKFYEQIIDFSQKNKIIIYPVSNDCKEFISNHPNFQNLFGLLLIKKIKKIIKKKKTANKIRKLAKTEIAASLDYKLECYENSSNDEGNSPVFVSKRSLMKKYSSKF